MSAGWVNYLRPVMNKLFLFLFLILSSMAWSQQVVRLRCDHLVNPLGMDNTAPRLSWNIEIKERNWTQSAYQVLVASDSLFKNNLWNSGKVVSSQMLNILYKGAPLKSFMNCWWKVRVWDKRGTPSAWSKPVYWKMGVLKNEDWKAQWIASDLTLKPYQVKLRAMEDFNMISEAAMYKENDTIRATVNPGEDAPAVYMRKEFSNKKKIKKATAYVCGLGLHELYLNGNRISNEYLNPAYTDYQKRVLYNTYDVTGYIKQGKNAIGVILGNGWYNLIVPHLLRYYAADYIDPPKLMMQVYIEYIDGSTGIIASDTSWKCTTHGPIVYNDILSGETYDANKEMPGWNTTGFNDRNWISTRAALAPEGTLRSQQLYPVQKLKTIPAVNVEKHNKFYRIDLGVDICGWAKIKLRGKKGDRIGIHYPGSGSHTFGRYQTHYFILKDTTTQVYEPRFSYNGFRYIDIEGLSYEPALSDVEGKLVATALPQIGEFACSNERFNKLQQVLRRTIDNYIIHIPNDPTREKSGWNQDIQNGFDVNAWNYDVVAVYRKWQYDHNDIYHDNGYVPPVVPSRFDGPTINGPWWGGMIVYNVAKLYEYYHDSDIVKESYEPMKRYIGYLGSIANNHIVEWGLGEWMEPHRANLHDPRPTTTPVPLTSTVAYYHFTKTMEFFALMLGKKNDAAQFSQLASAIKDSYNKRFFNAETGVYAQGSQTGQLLSLKYDLAPEGKRQLVIDRLKEFIAARDGHLSTGFVGTPILLTTLSDLGLSQEAYTMATKEAYPGWFDMVFKKGNSVMKENWEGGLVQMPSLAGPIGHWFFYSLAGIRNVPGKPAFEEIIIKPDVLDSLQWASGKFLSPQGTIISTWKKQAGDFELQVTIPPNTSARVYLPNANAGAIYESGKPISNFKTEKNHTIVRIGSGTYTFTIKKAGV